MAWAFQSPFGDNSSSSNGGWQFNPPVLHTPTVKPPTVTIAKAPKVAPPIASVVAGSVPINHIPTIPMSTVGNTTLSSPHQNPIINFLKNTAMGIIKPAYRTGAAISQGIGNLELMAAGKKPQNAQTYFKNDPVTQRLNKAAGYTGTLKQGVGDVIQTGSLSLPGVGGAAEKIAGKIAPTITSKVTSKLAGKGITSALARSGAAGASIAPQGALFGLGQGISDNQSAKNIAKNTAAGALFSFGLGASGSLVKSALAGFGNKVRTSILKNTASDTKPAMMPVNQLVSHEGAPDRGQIDNYKQQIQQGKPVEPLIGIKDSTGKIGIEDGKHRLQAYQELGINKVPVKVTTWEDIKNNLPKEKTSEPTISNLQSNNARPYATLQKQIEDAHNAGDNAKVNELIKQVPEADQPAMRSAMGISNEAERGSVAPGQAAEDIKNFINKTKQNISDSQAAGESAKNVGDKLYALKQNYSADQQELVKLIKGTEKFNNKDLEAAYHYAEDKTQPITDAQKAIHDQYVKPLIDETSAAKARLKDQGVNLNDNYVHRIAVDKGTGLERFLQGEIAQPRSGSILRKTTPSMKARTMYSITDDSGNRSVVSIKSPKNELGNVTGPKKITVFKNGKPSTLAKVSLDTPLTGDLTGKKFSVGDKTFTIDNATTKEIEANTKVRYYKNPIVNSALDYLNTRNAERANQFLNDWKTSPEFKNIAIKEGEGRIPPGWKTSEAPQFKGYYFQPKVKEALDDFSPGHNNDPLAALDGMNRFLRTSIFFNPLMHIPNIGTQWAVSRGLSGTLPLPTTKYGLGALIKTFPKAVHEVITAGPKYQQMLREGAPFMHFNQEQFSSQVTKMMENQLKDPTIATKVAKALGYANPKNLLKAFYGISHKATWYSNDIFTMQRLLEEEGKGKSTSQAIEDVGKYLPNYRLPTRFLGSRNAKQFLSNPNISMFMPYHYGILKSYGNLVRDLIGKSSIQDRAGAVDKILMGGLIGLVGYPALDKLAKGITGNPNASIRRSGPFTIPQAIADVVNHKPNATTGNTLSKAITPGIGPLGLLRFAENRDYFGNQIYDKSHLLTKDNAARTGKYISSLVSPVAQGQKIISSQNPKQQAGKFISGLFGISQPSSNSSSLQSKISKLLNNQFGNSGMTVQQQNTAKAKADARAQIAAGKGDALARNLVSQGTISPNKLQSFEKGANQSSLIRDFNLLSYENKLQLLQQATPQERKQLGDLGYIVGEIRKSNSRTDNPKTAAAKRQLLQLLTK